MHVFPFIVAISLTQLIWRNLLQSLLNYTVSKMNLRALYAVWFIEPALMAAIGIAIYHIAEKYLILSSAA